MRKTVLLYAMAALVLTACNNSGKTEPIAENTKAPVTKVDTPAKELPTVVTTATGWNGVLEIDDAAFEQKVLKNPGVTIVDFNAVWCGPCKALKPLFKEAASSFEGKANFASIDVDENPVVSEKYNVKSIPLLLFFKDGKLVNKIVGLIGAKELNAAVEKALKA